MFYELFEQSSDGLAIVDLLSLKIIHINSTFLDIIESDDELVGNPFRELIVLFCGEKNLESTIQQILTCIKENSEFVADAVFRDKLKKEKKYIRLFVKPLDNESFFVEAKDISEFEKSKLLMNKAINEAKLTSKLVTIASTNMNNQVVLDTVCRELAMVVGLPHIAMLVMEYKDGFFEVVAEHSHDARKPVVGQKIPILEHVVQKVFDTSQPLIIEYISKAFPIMTELKDILVKRGTVSLLMMPLNVRGQVIGIISFDSVKKHEFSQDEIYLVKHVAGTTGHILEVGRLYSELQTELAQRRMAEKALRISEDAMLAIYNITSSHTLTYSEKIQAMLSLGCQLFDMEVGALTHFENTQHEAIEIYSEKFNSAKEFIFYSSQNYCNILLDVKEPYTQNLAQSGYSFQINENSSFSLKSFMGVLVRVRGLSFGTLIFFSSTARSHALSPTDREFLRLMAQWMGTEIEREEFLTQLETNTYEIEIKNIELAQARDQALEISRLK